MDTGVGVLVDTGVGVLVDTGVGVLVDVGVGGLIGSPAMWVMYYDGYTVQAMFEQ